jgi:hypothetical protein
MKNKTSRYIMLISSIMLNQNLLLSVDTTIHYETYKDAPGYNTPVKDPKFDNVKPILFTPFEDPTTGDDSNKDVVGYFWPIKDPNKTLHFPGKARIGNSQYINVVAVDSKKVGNTGDSNIISYTDQEDLYKLGPQQKQNLDQILTFIIPIGTFMKPNDPTVYTLLGQYVSTVFPDPREIAVTGPSTTAHIVEE